MADFLRRREKQVKDSERLLVDGLESSPGQVAINGSLRQDAIAWMRGIVGSAVTGVGINTGMTAAVTSFGSASTGTAIISSLSGVAATNATMAILGGGSLASGGGGMVAGAAALNFVSIGPALLVSGLVVAGQGEKAKTKARENEAAVNVAIAEMEAAKVAFDAIQDRSNELCDLIIAIRVIPGRSPADERRRLQATYAPGSPPIHPESLDRLGSTATLPHRPCVARTG